ncbi:KpsF/GutQ family sugar-phosphate isomerase [Sphingomonas sp. ID0503]|uniref:KpsF/GutQ family sugar-phosphate isomerase n=1 Tax=Sphingomonas sp. ID0503 TaxID=3399691 RepID=UPI003AFA32D6
MIARDFAAVPRTDLRSEIAALIDGSIDTQLSAMRMLQAMMSSGALRESVIAAIELILKCRSRLIVTGVGKSGHIGRKVAATFASTGTTASFVHATEASHGDLGMVAESDVILAFSWSGETTELFDIVNYAQRTGVPVIAVTSTAESTLARHATVPLVLPRVREICQHGLAPSSSTLIQLAVGDVLAIAVSEQRGFDAADFHDRHPGGKLGAMLSTVEDLMATGASIPLVQQHTPMSDVILTMTSGRFGTAGVVDDAGLLVGVITDGDIRRGMSPSFLDQTAAEIMHADPKCLAGGTRVGDALAFMSDAKITVAFVVDDGRPSGIIHMHDLVRTNVV